MSTEQWHFENSLSKFFKFAELRIRFNDNSRWYGHFLATFTLLPPFLNPNWQITNQSFQNSHWKWERKKTWIFLIFQAIMLHIKHMAQMHRQIFIDIVITTSLSIVCCFNKIHTTVPLRFIVAIFRTVITFDITRFL